MDRLYRKILLSVVVYLSFPPKRFISYNLASQLSIRLILLASGLENFMFKMSYLMFAARLAGNNL